MIISEYTGLIIYFDRFGDIYETDYYTDVVKRQAMTFLDSVSNDYASKPFLMVLSPPAVTYLFVY